MRIGIDIRKPDWAEGQQRYLWRLGLWLSRRGHETHFINALRDRGPTPVPAGVHLHRLGWRTRAGVRRAVRDLELDILLLNPEKSRRYGGLAANVLRPGYGTEHYIQKLESFRNPVTRALRIALRASPPTRIALARELRFYRGSTADPEIIAMSRRLGDAVRHSYGIPEDRIHLIYNGVDLDRFSPSIRRSLREKWRREWEIPEGALLLLFLGHNYRLKGLWGIIELLGRLREAGIDAWLLAGGKATGPRQRRRAVREARARGCEEFVRFPGAIRPAERAFAAADVFVHPSWHDAFGNVVLEAMACGLPVVTTSRVGAAELLEHERSGMIHEPDDLDGMFGSIERLVDPAARERMGAAAALVAGAHGEESNFRQVLEVMERALAQGGGPVS